MHGFTRIESGMAMSALGYEISPLRARWTISLRLVSSIQTPITVFRADFSATACLHCPNNLKIIVTN